MSKVKLIAPLLFVFLLCSCTLPPVILGSIRICHRIRQSGYSRVLDQGFRSLADQPRIQG